MDKTNDILRKVRNTIHAVTPNAKIILFGSRARGNESPNSDWDFLVITENEGKYETEKRIWNNLYKNVELPTGEVITSIIYSSKEWEKLKITPLYQNIEKEGVKL